MMFADRRPVLRHLHHARAVHGAEAESRVHVETSAVLRPVVVVVCVAGDARSVHNHVLHVTPRQIRTGRDEDTFFIDKNLTFSL